MQDASQASHPTQEQETPALRVLLVRLVVVSLVLQGLLVLLALMVLLALLALRGRQVPQVRLAQSLAQLDPRVRPAPREQLAP